MRRSKRQARRPAARRKSSQADKKRTNDYRLGYGDGYKQGLAAGMDSYAVRFDGTSIIIPVRNQHKALERCIDSITEHTDLPYEIIVIDAGSEDGTNAYLKGLTGQVRYSRIEQGSRAAAVNTGLMMAKGTTMLVLDGGFTVTDGWLDALLNALSDCRGLAMIGPVSNAGIGAQKCTDYAPAENGKIDFELSAASSRRISTDSLGGFCFLLNRELWEHTGYLDERFESGDDDIEDYCVRVRLQGYSLYIAENAYVHFEEADQQRGGFGNPSGPPQDAKLHRFPDKWNNVDEVMHQISLHRKAIADDALVMRLGEASFYPQGVAVKGIQPTVYWIDHGRRLPIEDDWPHPVVTVSNVDLLRWERGASIKAEEVNRPIVPNDRLHRIIAKTEDNRIYYIEHGRKRRLVSEAAMDGWKLSWNPVVPWDEETMADLPEGLPIISPCLLGASL